MRQRIKNSFTHYWWAWLILIVASLAMIIPGDRFMHDTINTQKVEHRSPVVPVIFIPGSSATQERFNTLFSELATATNGNGSGKNRRKKHSQLKVTVKENGKLSYSGHLAGDDEQPFIVIAFQNNKDGYNNIKKQAAWLNIAINALAQKYKFNQFNGVGHSNGGLIWTLYLEKYFSQRNFSMNRLMTIATPYNFEETSINNKTKMFTDLVDGASSLPKNLTVYSVAGTESYTDDGIVPIQSVVAGKYIFQGHVKHYTQTTVTGNATDHSSLVENQQIVQWIRQYIIQDIKKPAARSSQDVQSKGN